MICPSHHDVCAADALIRAHLVTTPVLSNQHIRTAGGQPLKVKAEPLQHTGSFKYRGARHACMRAKQEGAKSIIAYSSGNHAQGVARACKELGLHGIIIMPSDAPALKMARVRRDGAEVVTYKRGEESREDLGEALAKKHEATLVKPYDDPAVIAGQGTLGLELRTQLDEPHDIIVCCGGGGLSSGIALALDGSGHHVYLAEPEGFDDWKRSLASGVRETNPTEQGSICDAIMTPTPGEITFEILKNRAEGAFAVPERDVREAMMCAWEEFKITAEPGGSVALAAALFQHHGERPVCAVVTGGNADPHLFAHIIANDE